MLDVFTKYAWVKRLKDKTVKTVFDDFIKKVNKSNRKRNKVWIDQGK